MIITGYADANSISTLPRDVRALTKPFTPDELNDAITTAIEAAGDEV